MDPGVLKDEYLSVMQYLTIERIKYKRVETKEYRELLEKNLEMEKKQEVFEMMVKDLME